VRILKRFICQKYSHDIYNVDNLGQFSVAGRQAVIRYWILLFAAGLSTVTIPLSVRGISASFAQSTDDDGEDDGGDDDDDGDVPDPDDGGGDNGGDPDSGGDAGSDPSDSDPGDTDPGDSDPGRTDPGDSDGGVDADGGDTDGGDDDAGPGAGVASGGDDDDDGAASSSAADDDDDDAPAAAASPGGGDDDDGAPSGGDDDDAPAAPGSTPADDDDDGPGDDGGADSGSGPETIVGGGDEDDDERATLDARDGIEVDKDGFRYRKNEFVALDLPQSDIALLQAEGFRVVETARLDSIGSTISLIKSPAKRSDQDMLSQIESISESASISFNYLFDTSTARIKKVSKTAVRKRTACGCDIGLIDTGVATNAGFFKHVQVQQKAFNGATVIPKVHGTGVAYLFAGTENGATKKRTRVFVGDIFGGERSQAGSSFALVKALDWMGQMKVPVINVSLAGPRSAAVAKTVEGLTRKGHIVVAAAGNDGPAAPPVFPGAYPGVVAVTAVDSQSKVYRYANRGNYIDLSSHGVEVPLIDNSGVPVVATGTSFASPTVARKLARAMTKPDVAAAKAAVALVEREARDLGVPGRDNIYGHGLVND
jgi:Subtilase family